MNDALHRTRPGKVSMAHVVSLGSRLTERDRQIVLDCYEHHVLTTGQIERLHFTGERTARERLRVLYELRVLDRFRPPWRRGEGSTPYHWILDEAGAHIVAELHGLDRRELKWRHSTALALSHSAKLRHLLEINEFFARLAQDTRRAGGALSEWYGERSSQRLFNGEVNPDGYGVVSHLTHDPIHVLLELDRATEPTSTLRDKGIRYAKALPRSVLLESRPVIILAVPTPARASAAAAATVNVSAPISVAVWDGGGSALEIVLAASRPRARRDDARGVLTAVRESSAVPDAV